MIKVCVDAVAHLFILKFQNSLATGTIATEGKRAKIVPMHKDDPTNTPKGY